MMSDNPDPQTDYVAIDCGCYDYLEVACLYNYSINIVLMDGTGVTGQAKTIQIKKESGEFLLVDVGGQLESIRLDWLRSIEAVNSNPHFSLVEFR